MKIDILGVENEIITEIKKGQDKILEDANEYVDFTTKQIFINGMSEANDKSGKI